MGFVASPIIAGILAGLAVALVGIAIVAHVIQRARERAEAQLDDVSGCVLQLAAALSEQTRVEGFEARVRLIREAHSAMSEQRTSNTAAARHSR